MYLIVSVMHWFVYNDALIRQFYAIALYVSPMKVSEHGMIGCLECLFHWGLYIRPRDIFRHSSPKFRCCLHLCVYSVTGYIPLPWGSGWRGWVGKRGLELISRTGWGSAKIGYLAQREGVAFSFPFLLIISADIRPRWSDSSMTNEVVTVWRGGK